VKKTIGRRLEILESAHGAADAKHGLYFHEVCFFVAFDRMFPDQEAAPKFLLAEYQRIARRAEIQPAPDFSKHTARRPDISA
jgi:hypothetical protein